LYRLSDWAAPLIHPVADRSPRLRFAGPPSLRLRRKKGGKFSSPYFFPVSRTASGESGQNMLACAVAGALANFAEAMTCASETGQNLAARDSDCFAG